jgi:hypothetical protein
MNFNCHYRHFFNFLFVRDVATDDKKRFSVGCCDDVVQQQQHRQKKTERKKKRKRERNNKSPRPSARLFFCFVNLFILVFPFPLPPHFLLI